VQRQAIVGRLEAVREAVRSRLLPCSWLTLRSWLAPRLWLPWLYRTALLALVLGVWRYCLRAAWPFTIDDAGISYAYAKHLAEGRGPVAVVGGPWVEGYSNPLWVFLLLPFHWLGLDLPLVSKVLGVLLLALSALSGPSALAAADDRWRSRGALHALFALALACCVEIVVWTVSGLENALFWALLTGLAYLDTRERRDRRALGVSGLLAFGLCITRPEGLLYVVPWVALRLVQALRQPSDRRAALRALLLWLGPLLSYHALHLLIFRHWVPNTFLAKSSRWDWTDGVYYLTTNVRTSQLVYLWPLVALGLPGSPRLKLLLVWNCLAGVAFVLYAGGDWMPHGRFVSLFAPAALLLATAGIGNASRALAWAARGRVPRELLALLLGAASLGWWWQRQEPRLAQLARESWCHFCERISATRAVQRLSEQAQITHATLLTQDFGGPAWLSSELFQPIDFLGLCDRNVALLRRDMVAHRGHLSTDFRFLQYLFHEQPSAPTWLSLPRNFWPQFDHSPEYLWDYFRVDGRLVPRARGSYFALHRGELVDYFPPVPRAEFRPLAANLVLIGAVSFADVSVAQEPASTSPVAGRALEQEGAPRVAPGVRVRTLLSVVRRGRLTGDEALELSIEAAGERVRSAPVPLWRGLSDLPHQLSRGEPLHVELTLELPRAPAATYRMQLGASRLADARAGREPTWLELEPLIAGAALPLERRRLPRYPAALPPALEPELRELRPAVTLAIEQRRRFGAAAPPDTVLLRRLIELGQSYEARAKGDPAFTPRAYLAYVWATQLEPRAWERLSDAIFRVRQTAVDDEHQMELALLQRYYASGDQQTLAGLIAFYLSQQRLEEARYFSQFRPADASPAETWASLARALEALAAAAPGATGAAQALELVARDPLGGALDFEAPALAGWQGDTAAYLAGPQGPLRILSELRGQHGQGVLSSLSAGDAGRGTLLSPPFALQGRTLSLLIGGGTSKQRVGVELLVDDVAVRTTSGTDSDYMYPELWDVSEYQGQSARLRVFDASKNAHVLVDRVLLWN